jgi:multidrug efflux system membrane fusion protein
MRRVLFISLCLFASCEKKPPPSRPPAPVTLTQPTVCDAPLYLEYVGHVTAYTSVSVYSQVSGMLVEQHFIDGQEVQAGDLLFVVDPRPYQAALAKAEATLQKNLASLKYAEDTASRYSTLVQQDYVAQLNYDQYVTQVLVDRATIDQNKADIDTAKINLSYCYTYAPMHAVTSKVTINVGNYIQAGATNPIATLTQIMPIYVDFYVPEQDLALLQPLQRTHNLKTQVFLNQDYDHPIEGELTLINNQVDINTASILLEATFANTDKALWPNEFVDVRVFYGEKKNAVLLPQEAVQYGQKGNYVFIAKPDMTAELRPVQIGQRVGNNVIIESGVATGEAVVLEGQISLYPGAKLAVKEPG